MKEHIHTDMHFTVNECNYFTLLGRTILLFYDLGLALLVFLRIGDNRTSLESGRVK